MYKKNIVAAIRAGVAGAFFGLAISFLLNYFLFPVPDSQISYAISNGMSGLFSGFFGGFFGLVFYLKTS